MVQSFPTVRVVHWFEFEIPLEPESLLKNVSVPIIGLFEAFLELKLHQPKDFPSNESIKLNFLQLHLGSKPMFGILPSVTNNFPR